MYQQFEGVRESVGHLNMRANGLVRAGDLEMRGNRLRVAMCAFQVKRGFTVNPRVEFACPFDQPIRDQAVVSRSVDRFCVS